MTDLPSRLTTALADRYRLERKLGEGGMATVYLAADLKHNRPVAIKVLKPELAAVVGAERFLAEIETTANLQHPHILPLFDSGEADGHLFFVMPYIEGETLADRIRRDKQLPVDEALGIATAVAGALQAAHEAGVVHRDIKPGNILLSRGQPLVADFGIALAVGAGGTRLTETGLSVGTPYYMSPEQATGDQVIGPAADIYALACVLYEMLVGEPPYLGNTAQAVLGKIIQGLPVSATAARKTVPANVDAAIRKALEKLPADRFTRAADFGAALAERGFRHGTAPDGSGPEGGAGSWNRRTVAFASLAAVFALTTAWGWLGRANAGGPLPVTVRTVVPDIEFRTFDERPEISRDGSLIAVRRALEGPQVWIRRADDVEFRALPGTEGGQEMTFSPDGRWLAFRQDAWIRRVEVVGGPVLPIATGFDPHWGTDDLIVFKGGGGALYTISPTGGDSVRWSATDSLDPKVPFLLPTGKAVVFSAAEGGKQTLMVLDLSSGGVTSLGIEGSSPRYVPAGFLLFGHPAQALMAVPFDLGRLEVTGEPFAALPGVGQRRIGETMFTVSDNGTALYSADAGGGEGRLVEVAVDGSSTATLPLPAGEILEPRYSPDGRMIAYTNGPEIFTYDRDTGAKTRVAEGWKGVWAPDGRHVYVGRGGVDRFSVDAPGDPEQVVPTAEEGVIFPLSAAPDGSGILLGSWRPQRGLDLTFWGEGQGSPGPRDFLVADWAEMAGAISPDGRWVSYASNESGTFEVYVRRLSDAGGPVRISSDGGFGSVWAPDGSAIYYEVRPEGGRRIVRSEVRSGDTVAAGPSETVFQGPFLVSSQVIPSTNFDVHPDGSRLLVVQGVGDAASGPPPVYLVTNWFAELRRRAGR